MNLIIDVGNTLVKFAVFKDKKLAYKVGFKLSEFKEQYALLREKYPKLKFSIISSVAQLSKKHIEIVEKDIAVLQLNYKTKLPFKNTYKTPKTLGVGLYL